MEQRDSDLKPLEALPSPPVPQTVDGVGADSLPRQSEHPVRSVWDLGPK
jgi:hypothetical protein